jgi:hypothetical protein
MVNFLWYLTYPIRWLVMVVGSFILICVGEKPKDIERYNLEWMKR